MTKLATNLRQNLRQTCDICATFFIVFQRMFFCQISEGLIYTGHKEGS